MVQFKDRWREKKHTPFQLGCPLKLTLEDVVANNTHEEIDRRRRTPLASNNSIWLILQYFLLVCFTVSFICHERGTSIK
jgi:hypothetical protein